MYPVVSVVGPRQSGKSTLVPTRDYLDRYLAKSIPTPKMGEWAVGVTFIRKRGYTTRENPQATPQPPETFTRSGEAAA